MAQAGDVIVVGAGILGAACAFECAEVGLRVIVLERGAPNREGSGTTAGNIHIQSIHRSRPGQDFRVDSERFVPLQVAVSELWDELEDRLDSALEIRRQGGFMVAETDADVSELRAKHEVEIAAGLRTEVFSGEEARAELGWLGPSVVAADFCREDGYANPLKVTPAYLSAAQRRGTIVKPFSEVISIARPAGNYRVTTARGDVYEAPTIVDVAGPWISRVARLAGIPLRMAPCAIQMHATVRIAPVLHQLVQHIGAGLSVKQVLAGNILVGGGWPAGDFNPAGRSAVNLASTIGNLQVACRILPFIASLRLLRIWAGPLATTPDELPVVGEVSGTPGFIVAGGTYAFTLAPLWGQVVRDLILGREPTVSLSGLGPDRLLEAPVLA